MKKIKLTILFILLIPSLCAAERVIPALEIDFALLGTPYNSHKNQIYNFKCINRKEIDLISPVVEIKNHINISRKKIIKSIYGDISAEISIPILSLKAGSHIVQEFSHSNNIASYSTSVQIRGYAKALEPDYSGLNITQKCQEYANQTINNSQDRVNLIGDEYISQINLGASFLGQIRIHFGTKKLHEKWKGNADVQAGKIWKVAISGYIESISREERSQISLEVKAIQLGGNPESIANIIPKNIMSCSGEHIGTCLQAYENLVKHANQLAVEYNDLQNLNTLNYTTTKYSDSGYANLVANFTNFQRKNKKIIKNLSSLYARYQKDIQFLNTELIYNIKKYTDYETYKINQEKQKIRKNIYLTSIVTDICYQYPYNEECIRQYKKLINGKNKLLLDYSLSITDTNKRADIRLIYHKESQGKYELLTIIENAKTCGYKISKNNVVLKNKEFQLKNPKELNLVKVFFDKKENIVKERIGFNITCKSLSGSIVSKDYNITQKMIEISIK